MISTIGQNQALCAPNAPSCDQRAALQKGSDGHRTVQPIKTDGTPLKGQTSQSSPSFGINLARNISLAVVTVYTFLSNTKDAMAEGLVSVGQNLSSNNSDGNMTDTMLKTITDAATAVLNGTANGTVPRTGDGVVDPAGADPQSTAVAIGVGVGVLAVVGITAACTIHHCKKSSADESAAKSEAQQPTREANQKDALLEAESEQNERDLMLLSTAEGSTGRQFTDQYSELEIKSETNEKVTSKAVEATTDLDTEEGTTNETST